MKNLKSKGE